MSPVLYSRGGYRQKVIQNILELGKLGVQFATFPETVDSVLPLFLPSCRRPFEIRTGKEHLKLLDQAVTITLRHHASDRRGREGWPSMVVSVSVNERDGGTIYNTQLLFDADGTLIQRRRKIQPDLSRAIDLGARRRLRICARCTARSDGLASWHAGSITIRWPVMP